MRDCARLLRVVVRDAITQERIPRDALGPAVVIRDLRSDLFRRMDRFAHRVGTEDEHPVASRVPRISRIRERIERRRVRSTAGRNTVCSTKRVSSARPISAVQDHLDPVSVY
jgi:hypothetical protein